MLRAPAAYLVTLRDHAIGSRECSFVAAVPRRTTNAIRPASPLPPQSVAAADDERSLTPPPCSIRVLTVVNSSSGELTLATVIKLYDFGELNRATLGARPARDGPRPLPGAVPSSRD